MYDEYRYIIYNVTDDEYLNLINEECQGEILQDDSDDIYYKNEQEYLKALEVLGRR